MPPVFPIELARIVGYIDGVPGKTGQDEKGRKLNDPLLYPPVCDRPLFVESLGFVGPAFWAASCRRRSPEGG